MRRVWCGSVCLNVLFILTGTGLLHQKGGLAYVRHKITGASTATLPDCRRAVWEATAAGPNDVILLGDSLVDFVEWPEIGLPIWNRGIAGNTTTHILTRLKWSVVGKPGKVILLAGINDIQQAVPLKTTLANMRVMVSAIHDFSPGTEVFILGVLPIEPETYRRVIVPAYAKLTVPTLDAVQTLNAGLSQIPGATFVSTEALCDSAGLRTGLSVDGLHLSAAGAQALADLIQPLLH